MQEKTDAVEQEVNILLSSNLSLVIVQILGLVCCIQRLQTEGNIAIDARVDGSQSLLMMKQSIIMLKSKDLSNKMILQSMLSSPLMPYLQFNTLALIKMQLIFDCHEPSYELFSSDLCAFIERN